MSIPQYDILYVISATCEVPVVTTVCTSDIQCVQFISTTKVRGVQSAVCPYVVEEVSFSKELRKIAPDRNKNVTG